jgi:hypothetical protein
VTAPVKNNDFFDDFSTEQTDKKYLILFWVRHGERLDQELVRQWKFIDAQNIEFKFDSSLTERGKQQAH